MAQADIAEAPEEMFAPHPDVQAAQAHPSGAGRFAAREEPLSVRIDSGSASDQQLYAQPL